MEEDKVINDWVDRDKVRALAESLLDTPEPPVRDVEEPEYGAGFEGFTGPVIPEARPEISEQPVIAPREIVHPIPSEVSPVVCEEARVGQQNPFQKNAGRPSPGSGLVTKAKGPQVPKKMVSSPFRASSKKAGQVRSGQAGGATPQNPPFVAISATKLESFVDWLKKEIPLEACFIGRGEKDVLFDDFGRAKALAVARTLVNAATLKGDEDGQTHRAFVVKLGAKQVMQVVSLATPGGRAFAALLLPRPLADGGVKAFVKALRNALD